MNLSITHKQRWLVITLIGITGAAFGLISSGNGIWVSLLALLSLTAFALLFKDQGRRQKSTSQKNGPTINKLEEMIKLIEQKDQGAISDVEYQERRADLIYNH